MSNGNLKAYATGNDGKTYGLEMGNGCYCSECCFHVNIDDGNCTKNLYEAFGLHSCRSLALFRFNIDVGGEVMYCYKLLSEIKAQPSAIENWKKLGGKSK